MSSYSKRSTAVPINAAQLLDINAKNRYNTSDMKSSIHPTTYRPVVFSDDVAGFAFLTQSTAQTNETIKWEDGNEYPLVKMHISSASHPFFTGEEKIIDTEGRVDRFKAKFAAAEARKEALASKAKKQNAQARKKAESSK
jgi:large subunit ribosomal protein L31